MNSGEEPSHAQCCAVGVPAEADGVVQLLLAVNCGSSSPGIATMDGFAGRSKQQRGRPAISHHRDTDYA